MGEHIKLTTKDGATIGAYKAVPTGAPRGGIVVLQEIFGVNHHIQGVADSFAAEGYLAIAPALFDRVQPGVELGYQQADLETGFGYMTKAKPAETLADVEVAIAAASEAGKVGIVGFCWGGRNVYLAAANLSGIAAGVSYYGGGIGGILVDKLNAPVMFHFGEKDPYIPLSDVDKVKQKHPDLPVYVYLADHGFNCDERGSYDKPSADLARQRTLEFLAQHLK
jgi:carboxymethylenebutenolidase